MWPQGESASSTSRPSTRWCRLFRAFGTHLPRTRVLSCDQRRHRLLLQVLLAPLPPLQVKPLPLLLPLLQCRWHDQVPGGDAAGSELIRQRELAAGESRLVESATIA